MSRSDTNVTPAGVVLMVSTQVCGSIWAASLAVIRDKHRICGTGLGFSVLGIFGRRWDFFKQLYD